MKKVVGVEEMKQRMLREEECLGLLSPTHSNNGHGIGRSIL